MRNLQVAWLSLLLVGVALVYIDVLFRVLLEIQGVPALVALGIALVLLALTSMLNWTFKVAWEEHSRANPDEQNDDTTGANPHRQGR